MYLNERETAINLPWLGIFFSSLDKLVDLLIPIGAPFFWDGLKEPHKHTQIYIYIYICIYVRYMYNIIYTLYIYVYMYIYICICICICTNMHTSRYNSSADRNGGPCGFKQRVSVSICFGPLAYGPLLSSHAPIGAPQKTSKNATKNIH